MIKKTNIVLEMIKIAISSANHKYYIIFSNFLCRSSEIEFCQFKDNLGFDILYVCNLKFDFTIGQSYKYFLIRYSYRLILQTSNCASLHHIILVSNIKWNKRRKICDAQPLIFDNYLFYLSSGNQHRPLNSKSFFCFISSTDGWVFPGFT